MIYLESSIIQTKNRSQKAELSSVFDTSGLTWPGIKGTWQLPKSKLRVISSCCRSTIQRSPTTISRTMSIHQEASIKAFVWQIQGTNPTMPAQVGDGVQIAEIFYSTTPSTSSCLNTSQRTLRLWEPIITDGHVTGHDISTLRAQVRALGVFHGEAKNTDVEIDRLKAPVASTQVQNNKIATNNQKTTTGAVRPLMLSSQFSSS